MLRTRTKQFVVASAVLLLSHNEVPAFNSFPQIACGGGNIHYDITKLAMRGFKLCNEALSLILNENTDQDRRDFSPPTIPLRPDPTTYHAEYHFDRLPTDGATPAAYSIAFKRGQNFVHGKQIEAIAAISHGGNIIALLALADGLHAVQDFFSHTNYVDFAEGSPEQRQAYQAVLDGFSDGPALLKLTGYSSTGENPPGDLYPHGEFSKDCPTKNQESQKILPNGRKTYDQARADAIAASIDFVNSIKNGVTAQEWSAFLDNCACGFSTTGLASGIHLNVVAPVGVCPVMPIINPVEIVTSNDPNDKVGAQGVTPQRYLSGAQPLSYSIYFDNQPSASAAAQTVSVMDTLNTNLVDLNRLTLGPISFVDKLVIPPSVPLALGSYSTDVDLRPGTNLIVRITASLNITTGVLKWTFTSLDPATGQPTTDPLAGFLPPGQEGSVLFTVAPKAPSTGAQITNKATIVFDVNPPIDTPVWLNTIDNTPPTSHVTALATTQTMPSFSVQWSGSDIGSGIQDFTIYRSDNGGPFVAWQTNIAATSATHSGQIGHTYTFYSIARDLVGNVEPSKTAPEATTTVTALPADLTVSMTHAGTFTPGGPNSTFTMWVSNVGAGPTLGAVTLKDTLPLGFTSTGLGGTGWNCDLAMLACTRSDVLPSNASYPPVTLTGQVRLFSAPLTFTNTATVSGGGDANPANNTAEDRAATVNPRSQTVQVTVTTVPAGLKISVDDVVTTSPRTLLWRVGDMHTISVQSPQPSPFQPGVQYVFNNWSDGGAVLHNVTVPASPAAFTATFKTP